MRRFVAGALAAGLALLINAPGSWAAANPSSYDGSQIITPTSLATPTPSIEALIVRKIANGLERLEVRSFLTTPAGQPSGCGTAGEAELTTVTQGTGQPDTTQSTAIGTATCNGSYRIRITARLIRFNRTVDSGEWTGSVDIVTPPGPVGTPSGSVEGSSVALSWPALATPPPDFKGYRILRLDPGGDVTLANVGPNERTYTDASPPPEGGKVTYQILARRAGPRSDVVSTSGGKVTVDGVPTATTTSTEPPPDGGTGGGTDGGTDGATTGGATGGGTDGATTGGTTDGGTTGGTSGGTKTGGGRTFKPLPKGQVGVGTKAPRLGTPSLSNIPDLVTPDGDFNERIDYGNDLAGDASEDGLSSFYYETGTGRGMAVPVATGFVFAAWAFHLRYLARAAKPAKPAGTGRGRRSAHSADF